MSNLIETIDDLIDELGGTTAVAKRCDIAPEAVSNWKRRGQIATGWHMRLAADVKRKGKMIHPDVFGMSEDDARVLFDGA